MQTNTTPASTTLGASLIITTYNSPDRLALVLDSVRDLSPIPAEVIIADDGSTDDTRELIESYAKSFPCPLRHIWQEDKGFRVSISRNKGIAAATQDYIITIDGDMIVDSHFIADHLRFAKRGVVLQGSRTGLSAFATQEILAAKAQNPHDRRAYTIAFAHKKAKSYRIGFMAYLANLRSTTARYLRKTPYLKPVVRTCNMSFYKSDWEKLGGFDEGYTGWGRDDTDFVARLLLQGGKLKRVTFSAVAYHIYHESNINPQALAINDKRYLAMLESHGITYPSPLPNPSDVSLVITTYNSPDRLALVLDSVRDLSPLPTEVIIADDGSTEETRILIESYAKHFPCPLRHIWQEDKGFRASAIRNKGVYAAKQDYIILIDGDMILDPHFIADHLRFAKRGFCLGGSRTMLGENTTKEILACRANGDTSAYKESFKYKSWKAYRCAPLAWIIYLCSQKSAKSFTKSVKANVGGCNMSFYKADFERVGGFNESFTGHGSEDWEFVARFLFAGGRSARLKFCAAGYHIHHPTRPQDRANANYQLYLETLRTHLGTLPSSGTLPKDS